MHIRVFIDAANLWTTAKELRKTIDFKKLRDEFIKQGQTLRLSYYTAVLEEEERNGTSTLRPLLDWLDYNGYEVVTKNARVYKVQGMPDKVKGNVDVEITVDMLTAAVPGARLWLFSGDGDFTRLVNECKRKGAHVTVVSSYNTSPSMCADELRRSADAFILLEDMNIFDEPKAPRKEGRWS